MSGGAGWETFGPMTLTSSSASVVGGMITFVPRQHPAPLTIGHANSNFAYYFTQFGHRAGSTKYNIAPKSWWGVRRVVHDCLI